MSDARKLAERVWHESSRGVIDTIEAAIRARDKQWEEALRDALGYGPLDPGTLEILRLVDEVTEHFKEDEE